ncbi:O-antigen ligase family protein [Sphingomonas aurea]|uniref:O-antigen ligase family protein n=1 Tax=Sphingomonas aurea TaxID=3063994 RepID=UPI00272F50E6|nr:O-antigen ligase family protein [Sphingomonas sp. KR1UV-12]
MHKTNPPRRSISLLTIATAGFVACLWLFGGASRGNVSGQIMIRGIAWAYLLFMVLLANRERPLRGKPVLYLLIGAAAIVLVQLVPLPPVIWAQLPGRALFTAANDVTQGAPWRPLAIVPSAAVNAACSLIVPLVMYLLVASTSEAGDWRLIDMLLIAIVANVVVGLVQLAGIRLANPFVNAGGAGAGMFANRNHFALLLALGCLIAPVWAFGYRSRFSWRAACVCGLIPLILLTILASGSRAGLALGIAGAVGGILLVWNNLSLALVKYPRWVMPAVVGLCVLGIGVAGALSFQQDRASSINRVMAGDVEGDMRSRAFPTVKTMAATYFPVGEGFGGFDTIFRVHEPDALLKPTYFNRVHNDFVEIVLDGGAAGGLLLMVGLSWWLYCSARAWLSESPLLARLGSLMVLLIAAASIIDYPARTPIIMALTVISGVWLSSALKRGSIPLPDTEEYLSRQ